MKLRLEIPDLLDSVSSFSFVIFFEIVHRPAHLRTLSILKIDNVECET